MAGKAAPATAKGGPELAGGDAVVPLGDGDEGVVVPVGGVAAVVVPVTLMASCWPREQWLGKVQVKKC